tara:strand:+ start:411 stop:560 length:150 start_codon:yes stop_codon:yes gene_type:complete
VSSLANLKTYLSKSKYGKYLIVGGFAFFFIKGLIYLALIIAVSFGLWSY